MVYLNVLSVGRVTRQGNDLVETFGFPLRKPIAGLKQLT